MQFLLTTKELGKVAYKHFVWYNECSNINHRLNSYRDLPFNDLRSLIKKVPDDWVKVIAPDKVLFELNRISDSYYNEEGVDSLRYRIYKYITKVIGAKPVPHNWYQPEVDEVFRAYDKLYRKSRTKEPRLEPLYIMLGMKPISMDETLYDNITFGIEIEFEPPSNDWDYLKIEFKETFDDWIIKYDGSFFNGNGGEVTSPVYRLPKFDEAIKDVTKIVEWLSYRGCETHRGAGIHVHVGYRETLTSMYSQLWGIKTMRNVAKLFLKYEDVMYKLSSSGWDTHRGRSNGFKYCLPLSRLDNLIGLVVDSRTLDDLNYAANNRYVGLNLASYWHHNTVEFRVFNSTLNPQRLEEYMSICIAMVKQALAYTMRAKEVRIQDSCYVYGTVTHLTNDEKEAIIQEFVTEMNMTQQSIELCNSTSNWQG